MSEAQVQADIALDASEAGHRLLRNNVGAYKDKRGKWVHYGVGGNGGSDLVGWSQVLITPEMVGRRVPVFTVVEVKENAKPTKEQLDFIGSVLRAGGIAGIAHSPKEYRQLIENF